MARAIWSGIIGFGLVSIPVKMYAATEKKDVSFHQLHEACQSRIKEQRWCPTCERQVEWDEIVKGYEYAKGHYVVVTDKDLEKLPVPSKNLIDVASFVELQEIDPIYFERTYYLEPERAASHPFSLLWNSLKSREMVALGTVTIRTKERLCALRPVGNTLLLSTLLYPDEIRIDLKASAHTAEIAKNEMSMANSLINLLTEKFDPEKYEDHYRKALLDVIDAKVEGMPAEEAEKQKRPSKVIDLMDALRASIETAKDEKSGKRRAKTKAETRPGVKTRARKGRGTDGSRKSGSTKSKAHGAA